MKQEKDIALQETKNRSLKNRKFRELWNRPGYLIRRLHQIHLGLFAEECKDDDVTPVQFGMLSVLASGVEMDQLSLSTSVGVDRASGADVIKRLERRGLLQRNHSEIDRRARVICITPKGSEFVEKVRPKMARAQARLVAPLTEEEFAELERILKKLVKANNDASRAPLGVS
ncbi:MAG: MarR family transcriptional regulator [Aestuariivita sp.]|nr:MarR family transcriptional regulator [Aestuariivita sp.]MCY4204046.1 MarR family transcriptional regulator [Aestuariivita sp.]MCY4287838.1 MarR family transcriptional regulator [Aestuariivita sp.]MCY4345338.1 MarR family transcriptional regulator [Aestuariivita sp.]